MLVPGGVLGSKSVPCSTPAEPWPSVGGCCYRRLMAYPANFLRLVAIGSLPGGEQWTWSLSFIADFSTLDPPATVPQGVIDALETFHESTEVGLGTGVLLNAVKLNEIGTDGRYVSPSATVEHIWDPPVGASNTVQVPPQTAVAISLLTAKKRGLAHRGRFFLPVLGYTTGPDGRMSAVRQAGLGAAVVTMLQDLNTALGPNQVLGVVSDRRTGASNPVTDIAVGRVYDTIRSRRKKLVEDYLTLPLSP